MDAVMDATMDELKEATIEEQFEEAKLRMKMLKIYPETCRQFIYGGKLSYSLPPFGAYFWLNEDEMKAVIQFETENHALVYSVIRSIADDSILDSCLYISRYPCEWKQDREDIRNGTALVRVLNRQYPHLSDTGYIGFELGLAGGLIRTY